LLHHDILNLNNNNNNNNNTFIELGTGTVFLSIYLTLHSQIHGLNLQGYATDLEYTEKFIKSNIDLNDVEGVRFKELDWFKPEKIDVDDEIDYVFAADCVYLESLVKPFCNALLKVLSVKTKCFIGHQVRGGCGEIENKVERYLVAGGAKVERINWNDVGYEEHRLMIWSITR
jgi:hypothetical protein